MGLFSLSSPFLDNYLAIFFLDIICQPSIIPCLALVADILHLELCLVLALCNDNKALSESILLDFHSVPGDEIRGVIAANADCQAQVRTVSLSNPALRLA